MQKSRVQKLITFSPQLYTLVEDKAQRLGVSFPEYIRTLAIEDVKEEAENYLVVSPELEEQIGLALEDVSAGRISEIDPDNEDDLATMFGDK